MTMRTEPLVFHVPFKIDCRKKTVPCRHFSLMMYVLFFVVENCHFQCCRHRHTHCTCRRTRGGGGVKGARGGGGKVKRTGVCPGEGMTCLHCRNALLMPLLVVSIAREAFRVSSPPRAHQTPRRVLLSRRGCLVEYTPPTLPKRKTNKCGAILIFSFLPLQRCMIRVTLVSRDVGHGLLLKTDFVFLLQHFCWGGHLCAPVRQRRSTLWRSLTSTRCFGVPNIHHSCDQPPPNKLQASV